MVGRRLTAVLSLANAQPAGPTIHGPEAPAGQAASSIAKTIADMPPQQLFEIMKDIKVCPVWPMC